MTILAAIQQAMKFVAVSENERDSAGEPANLVDGLFAIARAIERATETVATGLEALHGRLERIEEIPTPPPRPRSAIPARRPR